MARTAEPPVIPAWPIDIVYNDAMSPRWLEAFWTLRCVDQRGDSRAVKYPSLQRLKRMGLPHPYRSFLRISPAWWFPVFMLPMLGFLALRYLALSLFGVQSYIQLWTYTVLGLPRGAVYLSVGALYFFVTFGVLAQFSNRFIPLRYVHELLANDRCPWCAYDLSGGEKDADLQTTCPECGGVWRMP